MLQQTNFVWMTFVVFQNAHDNLLTPLSAAKLRKLSWGLLANAASTTSVVPSQLMYVDYFSLVL
jgi:hypothetical protein